jgi:hypothetical protein
MFGDTHLCTETSETGEGHILLRIKCPDKNSNQALLEHNSEADGCGILHHKLRLSLLVF